MTNTITSASTEEDRNEAERALPDVPPDEPELTLNYEEIHGDPPPPPPPPPEDDTMSNQGERGLTTEGNEVRAATDGLPEPELTLNYEEIDDNTPPPPPPPPPHEDDTMSNQGERGLTAPDGETATRVEDDVYIDGYIITGENYNASPGVGSLVESGGVSRSDEEPIEYLSGGSYADAFDFGEVGHGTGSDDGSDPVLMPASDPSHRAGADVREAETAIDDVVAGPEADEGVTFEDLLIMT